jgi:O-antigen ligase
MEIGVIFTWLLTIAGCIYGLINPVYGISAYFALSILKPRALWFWSVAYHRYTYWVALCALTGWVLKGFGDRSGLGRMKIALFCMATFVAWQWLSLALNGYWPDVYLRYHCQKITDDMLAVFVALTLITTFKHLRIFTYVILLSTGYLAYEMNYAYVIQHWNRLWIREFAGIDNNGMAMIFAMTVPLAIGLGAYEKSWKMKVLAWSPIPLNIHAVEFSMSRTGMLGLFACIPFLAWLMPRKLRATLLVGLVIFGGLSMAGPSVRQRFSSIFLEKSEMDASASSRYQTWAAGWQAMNDRPWLGYGPRGFNRVAHEYGLSHGKSIHNLFLQVGADTGFPGMISLIGIFVGTGLALLRNRKIRTQYSPWYPYWCAMVVSGLGSMVICSQFIGMERVEMPYYLCGIGLAAVKVALIEQTSPQVQMARASESGSPGPAMALASPTA